MDGQEFKTVKHMSCEKGKKPPARRERRGKREIRRRLDFCRLLSQSLIHTTHLIKHFAPCDSTKRGLLFSAKLSVACPIEKGRPGNAICAPTLGLGPFPPMNSPCDNGDGGQDFDGAQLVAAHRRRAARDQLTNSYLIERLPKELAPPRQV